MPNFCSFCGCTALYIFDEPTSGLDPLMERIFQEEVLKLKEQGKWVLLSSYILSEVEKLADRVVIIRGGEIVKTGTLEELRHITRSTVTAITKGDISTLENEKGVHDFVFENGQAVFSVDREHLNNILEKSAKLGVKNLKLLHQHSKIYSFVIMRDLR